MSFQSRPARGAWIDIASSRNVVCVTNLSRPARGAWIEITKGRPLRLCSTGRAPQGARGLK